MAIGAALYSSRSEEWATPQEMFDALAREFGPFACDMAATRDNAKCLRYVDREIDALAIDWYRHVRCDGAEIVLWCNPPYGRAIGQWFAKAREAASHGATVVMLAHARTDTRWWHEHVQGIADEVRFLKGRVKFVGPDGVKSSAPFPSAVIVYRGKCPA